MPRGTPNTKPTPLLIELHAFAEAHAKTDYADLAKTFEAAGWVSRLVETGAIPAYDGTVLMTYDLLIGRADGDTAGNVVMEKFDTLTMRMPPGPGPVSVAARVAARETVVFLLSGRLPPKPVAADTQPRSNGHAAAAPEPEQRIDMDDADQELVSDNIDAPGVVARREADGLPIFVDLYAVGAPTRAVIDAVLDECAQFLETASAEQVKALAAKNEGMTAFVKDLGDIDGAGENTDLAELMAMVKRRKEQLAEAALPKEGAAMRRRAAGARAAN